MEVSGNGGCIIPEVWLELPKWYWGGHHALDVWYRSDIRNTLLATGQAPNAVAAAGSVNDEEITIAEGRA